MGALFSPESTRSSQQNPELLLLGGDASDVGFPLPPPPTQASHLPQRAKPALEFCCVTRDSCHLIYRWLSHDDQKVSPAYQSCGGNSPQHGFCGCSGVPLSKVDTSRVPPDRVHCCPRAALEAVWIWSKSRRITQCRHHLRPDPFSAGRKRDGGKRLRSHEYRVDDLGGGSCFVSAISDQSDGR